jgi:ABC-type dipeptide/oligopeptide/nickel transport system ATPase component
MDVAIEILVRRVLFWRGVFYRFFEPPPACRFHPRCEHATPRCAEEPSLAPMEITPSHELGI